MRKSLADLLIFTDLDGSLLDHHSYRWDAAKPWLDRLAQAKVPLIVATSKTAAEVQQLQQQLGLSALPFIAENGAQIVFPAFWQQDTQLFGADYPSLLAALDQLRQQTGFAFQRLCRRRRRDGGRVDRTDLVGSASGAPARRLRTNPLVWQRPAAGDFPDAAGAARSDLDARRSLLPRDGPRGQQRQCRSLADQILPTATVPTFHHAQSRRWAKRHFLIARYRLRGADPWSADQAAGATRRFSRPAIPHAPAGTGRLA
ncbi:Putative mannosyl-3-phosphoglycerate phosphatase [Serratia odorifera]|uniref:Mannosyl-3-phosphoglycerate phosphatase n=1 Tax=Serratia odorifera TaxID=618 RepID=A0A447KYH1_SEROD|nr:Putative mannosyl-3-phosphoglycerate phosphatase [Serratia odorifera]